MEIIPTEIKISDRVLRKKLDRLKNDDATMIEVHNLFAKMCNPYVPFLEGMLSQSGLAHVTAEGVEYNVPYAHYQYNGTEFNHTLDYHPLASAEWDKAMLQDHKKEFEEQVKRILIRRAKQLYG